MVPESNPGGPDDGTQPCRKSAEENATAGAPMNVTGGPGYPVAVPPGTTGPSGAFWDMFGPFFQLTGGSVFYCISAVLVAYGTARLLGPVLATTQTFRAAIPCVTALAVYELALLAVLLLIVWRKVVDDAISVAVILALYMVATATALGSVVERQPNWAWLPAALGTALALVKCVAMWRWARIPVGGWCLVALVGLIAVDYFLPIGLARSVQADPSAEAARRGLWHAGWWAVAILAGLMWTDGLRRRHEPVAAIPAVPFLQSRAMVYLLGVVLLGASTIHQYATAYMFVVPRRLGEFLVPVGVGSLVILELLAAIETPLGILYGLAAFAPAGVLGLAIYNKAVIASGVLGLDIVVWPPVFCAWMGLALAVGAWIRRWRWLLVVAAVYAVGVAYTWNYDPQYPWRLHPLAAGLTVTVGLAVYGLLRRQAYACLAAVGAAVVDVALLDGFQAAVQAWNVTPVGALTGVAGCGVFVVGLIFVRQLPPAVRTLGLACLAVFFYDVLPPRLGWQYGVVTAATALLGLVAWLRARQAWSSTVLIVPLGARIYMMLQCLAHWRIIIVGFLLLAVGAVASLVKGGKTRGGLCGEP